jgi:predicted nucleic acid-binding protein
MIGADTTLLVQLELVELPAHAAAHKLLRQEVLDPQIPLALAPQILSEFIHVVTDPRRFQKPLTMNEAIAKADFWWNAAEVQHVFPTADSVRLFHDWMRHHQLGRKRILDTQLAATLWDAGVRSLITSNRADFQIFGFRLMAPEP